MRLFCVILCFLPFQPGISQVDFSTKVDSLRMVIGDQQSLLLSLTSSDGVNPADIHTEFLDTCSFLEIIHQSTWTRTEEDQKILQQKTIRFGIFDEGHFIIPACFTVVGSDTLWTYPIPIDVSGIEPDSTGLKPIKGIIKEPKTWIDYLGWMIGLISILLGYLIYRYIKSRQVKKQNETIQPPAIILPPHEIALQKLNALKLSRLWEQGDVKEFHVQLTYILREYLEHRFDIPALESTSLEIGRDIKRLGLTNEQVNLVHDLLHVADWVKFARGNPEENANSLAVDHAIDLVMQTKPSIEPSSLTNH